MRRYLPGIGLIIGLFGVAVEGSAQSKDAPSASPAKVSRDASALALKADASLQKPVTVEATDLPLGEVLQELSQQSDAALRAMPKIEDQRVTLHLTAQPLYQVMTRLCGLLSHSPSAPRGYFWTKESQGKDPHPHYRLQRDLRSITEEQDALDIPHQKAIRLLRDWRDLARMSVEQRKRYKGDLPAAYVDAPTHRIFQDALTDASDSQIETLVQTGSIPVNTALFADKIAAFNKAWRDRQVEFRQREFQSGHPDPFPTGVPDAPPDPPTVSFAVEDENGEQPELSVIFGLKLNGVQTADAPSGSLAALTWGQLFLRACKFITSRFGWCSGLPNTELVNLRTLTLKMRLPEAGPWNMRRDAEDLRFLGSFSAAERATLERDGMAIADMSPQQQAVLLARMRSRGGNLSADEVSRCRFFLLPDPRFQTDGHRITRLEVRSDGDKVLWLMTVEYQTVKEKSIAP